MISKPKRYCLQCHTIVVICVNVTPRKKEEAMRGGEKGGWGKKR
jgi:hypothetical protein